MSRKGADLGSVKSSEVKVNVGFSGSGVYQLTRTTDFCNPFEVKRKAKRTVTRLKTRRAK